MKIVLASGSPRRRELMNYITEDFIVCTSNAEENLPYGIDPFKAVEYLAVQKASAAATERPDDIVIGCDTIVIVDGKILGKPSGEEDARNMLRTLSGRTHDVVTGCAVGYGGEIHSFSEKTGVSFYALSEEEIEEYLATGESFDKAGGYGIQGKGALFVSGIKGDYYNVVGLPIAALSRKLREIIRQNKGEQ